MTCLLRLVEHRLDDGTRDLVAKEVAERVTRTRLDPDADQAILAGIGEHALSRYLPGEILEALRVFPVTGRHALRLANLPREDWPATPVSGFGAETDLAATNAVHFGLIRLLGVTPFAVPYENGGRLIRNVVPNPEAAGKASSWGADAEFFWHTDNPHLPFGEPGGDPRLSVPRYLTFYAIRNTERVPTELTSLDDALARLDQDSLRRLREPVFTVGAPASVDDGAAARDRTPLLESERGGDRIRFDRGTTGAATAAAAGTLEAWSAALDGVPSEELVLDSGEFLIFDNYRLLHRRKAFTPAPVVQARWLRRCYAG
jgi:L-asparagine oxygenase